MNIIKTLIALSLAGGAYAAWKHHHQHAARQDAANLSIGAPGAFVPLPPVDGQRPRTVFVIAAEDCPHEDAQRADRLAESLSSQGIPVERTHSANFRFTSQPDSDTVDRISAVMNGPLPVVFIDGRAKANPSLDEVASEFRRSAPQASASWLGRTRPTGDGQERRSGRDRFRQSSSRRRGTLSPPDGAPPPDEWPAMPGSRRSTTGFGRPSQCLVRSVLSV